MDQRRMARRAALGILAAGTVAGGLMLRKPAQPATLTPNTGPDPEVPPLQDISALRTFTLPRAMPAITWHDADGRPHTLAELAGRGVVLNLWATWCAPCVAELPSLAAFARQAAADNIAVLALSVERGGAPTVARYFSIHGIEGLAVLTDPMSAAAQTLGTRGVPTTLVIDRQGRERGRLEGGADWSTPQALAAVRKLV